MTSNEVMLEAYQLKIADYFRKFAHTASHWMGTAAAFFLALLTIIVWALLGTTFSFSDTWQLVINTATTIVTFLMVFLIQNTQNRDARAIHLKLDELIRANRDARNRLIELEDLSDPELDKLHEEFCELHKETEDRIAQIQKTRSTKSRREWRNKAHSKREDGTLST